MQIHGSTHKNYLMDNTKIFKMPFSKVYPLYVQKAERKGRLQAEVDEIILWLTGYEKNALRQSLHCHNLLFVNTKVYFL